MKRIKKCPYCGETMEKGTLRGSGGCFFLPKGEETPAILDIAFMHDKHAVWLTPSPYYLYRKTYWPFAYVCRNCGLIIVPFDDI